MMIFSKYVMKIVKASLFGVTCAVLASAVNANTLGTSIYDGQHTFSKTMVKYSEQTTKYYDQDDKFGLRLNGELGDEKYYVPYLNSGLTIDYITVAPSYMARFAPTTPLMDMPFLAILTSGNN